MGWSWKKDAVKQSIPLGLCSYVMPQAINFARYLPAWVQLRVMAVWKPLIPLLAFSCQGVLQGWMTSKCHVCDNSMGVTSVRYWWGQACQQHPSLRPNDLPRRRLIFFFFFQGWLYWYESAEVLNYLVLKLCHGCWVFWVGFSRQLVKGSWVGRGCHSGLENSLKQHFLLADTVLTALCCRCFRGNIFSSEIAKSKDICLL